MDYPILGQLKNIKKLLIQIDGRLDKIELSLLEKEKEQAEKIVDDIKVIPDNPDIELAVFEGRDAYFASGMGWVDSQTGQKLTFDQKGKLTNNFNK